MKKVATFISSIYGITISEPLGRGDKLDERLSLTNDPELIRSLITDRMTVRIGVLDRESICKSGLVAYSEFSGDDLPADGAESEGLIAVQLAKLHLFVQMLWLVKDNAANVENGFIDSPQLVSSRIWSMTCVMADGSATTTTFSRDELRTARELYRLLSNMSELNLEGLQAASLVEVVQSEISPLSRAIFFIGTARSTNHLSVKIANYCSAPEALLISSPTELTYRLSQRVAWLLGTTPDHRHELFQQLKMAYDFRSKAVHGSYVSTKKLQNDLQPAVVACDRILRDVVSKVIEDEALRPYVCGTTKSIDDFEDRLLRLSLGADQVIKGD